MFDWKGIKMYKLILADIKVLGHKLWQIPLIVTLALMLLWFFIPSPKDKMMPFFGLIPLISGILGLELMRLLQDNKLHYQMSSLPCSKIGLVIQKFVMLGVFILAGIICQFFILIVTDLINPDQVNKFTNGEIINFTLLLILRIAIFTIPLFFKFKKSVKAFFLFFAWLILMAVIHTPITLELLYARNSITATIFIYVLMFVVSIISAYILFLKDRKKIVLRNYLVIPLAVIFPISLALLQELMNSLIHRKLLIYFLSDKIDTGRMEWIFGRHYPYLFVHLVTTMVLLGIGCYIWKKGDNGIKKMIRNASLVLLLPVAFFAMENSIRIGLFTYQIITSMNNPDMSFPLFSISQYIVFIPMLIVSIYYSKKFLTGGD